MMRLFLKNFFRKETVWRAVRVALIVAPVLIIINHHDRLLELSFTPRLALKCVLTFFVPYCVSAYSSAMAYTSYEMSFRDSLK
jgi:hypothetical protein